MDTVLLLQSLQQPTMNPTSLPPLLEQSCEECLNQFHVANAKQYCKRVNERFHLIQKVESSQQVEQIIQQKYFKKSTHFYSNAPIKHELSDCLFYISHKLYQLPMHQTWVQRLEQDTEFMQRLFVRLYLLQQCWNVISIERLICSCNAISFASSESEIVEIIYIFIQTILQLDIQALRQQHPPISRGRPKIPECLQPYFEQKRNMRNKQRMRVLYNKSKLFTTEDLQLIQQLIQEQQSEPTEQMQQLQEKIEQMLQE